MIPEIKYLLQMACWLAGFWMVYFFFLRKETHFFVNRLFLLSGVICSIILPLIPVQYSVLKEIPATQSVEFNQINFAESTTLKSFSHFDLIKMIYLAGFLFMFFRFIIEVVRLFKLRSKGKKIRISNTEIFQLEKEIAPFSFFNLIFVSKSMGEKSVLETIIAHEKVHIKQRHWIDLILLELIRAIQWFNPFVIIYRKAMMENHEYLADSGVISKGVNSRNYQAVLINQMLGVQVIQLASSFTKFNESKRIKMINKEKSSPIKRWKIFWAIPLATILMVIFAEPKYVYGNDSSVSPESGQKIKITGKVIAEEGDALPGTSIFIANSTRGTVSDINGNFILDDVLPDAEIIFSFVGLKTQRIKASKNMTVKMEAAIIPISTKKSEVEIDVPPPQTTKNLNEEQKEVFIVVEEDPHFKGGQNEMVKFLVQATADSQEKGTVSVNFVVNSKGEIQDIEIMDSPSDKLSKQAEKIMKSMPAWEPGKQRGKSVRANCNLQITF